MSAAQKYSAEIVVAGLIAFISWFTISQGTPQVFAPLNLLIVAPSMWAYEVIGEASIVFAILIVPIIFCVWSIPVLHGSTLIPFRSLVLTFVAIALSAIGLILGFNYGVQYHSATYVAGVTMINLACYIAIIGLAVAGRKHPTYIRNLLFHGALFAWLAWMAFPWLGELP